MIKIINNHFYMKIFFNKNIYMYEYKIGIVAYIIRKWYDKSE